MRSDGAAHTLKVRIELKLRDIRFEDNTDFQPSAEDLQLCDEDFNEKFEGVAPGQHVEVRASKREDICACAAHEGTPSTASG